MELFDRIELLATHARQAEPPPVDVVDRVCRTVRLQREDPPALLDWSYIAFTGLSLTVTGVAAVFFLPLLTTLWDPWTAYMNAPWSL